MCAEFAQNIQSIVKVHEDWRNKCLNLIPSENLTSPQVRKMLASDFGHRYAWDKPWYGGQKYTVEIEKIATKLAKKIFQAKYANIRPLSGHLSLMSVIMGLCVPNDSIVISHIDNGGYPLNLQRRFPLDVHYFPYHPDMYTIDVTKANELITQVRPRLVIFGASIFLQPHPVHELVELINEMGAVPVYDGSHVLGLIAGNQFQDPFQEGAKILLGSTHKTFFGPQGGIILVKDDMTLAEQIDVTLRPDPVLVDNYHHNRVTALAIALAEMQTFGKEYAKLVVTNAKKLAHKLDERNVPLVGAEWDFTSSHQVLLQITNAKHGQQIREQLEAADIIADAGVRLGSQEITRRGMKPEHMEIIAELITQRLDGKHPDKIKQEVHSLTNQFQAVDFCFNAGE